MSFCFSPSAVVLPALYIFLHRQTNETIPLQFPRCVSLFFTRKNLWEKLSSLNVCEAALQGALQAPIKGGNFGAKLTHLCCSFWLDVSFFSLVKIIVLSSEWLELICVWKFATKLFAEYFSVCPDMNTITKYPKVTFQFI